MRRRTEPSAAALILRDISAEDIFSALKNEDQRNLSQTLWERADGDQSLKRQLAVKVLRSRLAPHPVKSEVLDFLSNLLSLCEFEAEYRQDDHGWSLFLAEVVDSIENIFSEKDFSWAQGKFQEIVRMAENSSSQMDDCYSCYQAIERLQKIFSLPMQGE